MPKLPEPAPTGDLQAVEAEVLSRWFASSASVELVQRANRDYLYWDRFKHLPMPEDLSPEDGWRILKTMRAFGRHGTPAQDTHGHRFSYVLTEEVQRCLHVIDLEAGGPVTRAGVTFTVPVVPSAGAFVLGGSSRDRFLVSSLMEEAIASSQIEGASTTRRAAKDMLRAGREPRDRPEQMILNNYRTVSRLRELRGEPITTALLIQIQAWMTDQTLDDPVDVGRLRTSDDILVHDGMGTTLHLPPPAATLPEQMDRLCAYANADGPEFEHPVIKAVILHFWLAYLHPFADGNGRTARALFYLFMLKHGYWLFEFLSVSRVILHRRGQYDRAYLYAEADDCDMTYFLNFHLRAIEAALTDLWEYLGTKAEEDRAIVVRLQRDQRLNHRQRAILSRALADLDAVFTIESHRASHNVVYATARSDLLDLVKRGYLDQRREGRAFSFVPAADLRDKFANH
jgi:Fic family protein